MNSSNLMDGLSNRLGFALLGLFVSVVLFLNCSKNNKTDSQKKVDKKTPTENKTAASPAKAPAQPPIASQPSVDAQKKPPTQVQKSETKKSSPKQKTPKSTFKKSEKATDKPKTTTIPKATTKSKQSKPVKTPETTKKTKEEETKTPTKSTTEPLTPASRETSLIDREVITVKSEAHVKNIVDPQHVPIVQLQTTRSPMIRPSKSQDHCCLQSMDVTKQCDSVDQSNSHTNHLHHDTNDNKGLEKCSMVNQPNGYFCCHGHDKLEQDNKMDQVVLYNNNNNNDQNEPSCDHDHKQKQHHHGQSTSNVFLTYSEMQLSLLL